MVWIAAAAASLATASAAVPASTGPVVQARATVRILRATRLTFDGKDRGETPPVRAMQLRLSGVDYPARLIEFE